MKRFNKSFRHHVQTTQERKSIKRMVQSYKIFSDLVRPQIKEKNKDKEIVYRDITRKEVVSIMRYFSNSYRVEFAKYSEAAA